MPEALVPPPQERKEGEAFIYLWVNGSGAPEVSIEVDRISEHADAIKAEMTVRAGPNLGHLYFGDINLKAVQTRNQWARLLAERYPIEINWPIYLEHACVRTIRALRAGEPTTLLGMLPQRERSRYALNPLILDREPTLIYGDGGSGKSLIAMACSVSIASGLSVAGMQPASEAVSPVLYLDWETTKEEANERLLALCTGLDLPGAPPVHYQRCYYPLREIVSTVRRTVDHEGIGTIAVDSAGGACGGEPESAEVALNLFTAIRQIGINTLIVHHIPKDTKRGPFGSRYFWNYSRSVWRVRAYQDEEAGTLFTALFHEKVNTGRRLRPLGLRADIEADEDGRWQKVTLARCDVRSIPELASGQSPKQEAIGYLREVGEDTATHMAEALRKHRGNISAILNSGPPFVKTRKVGREQFYGLASSREAEEP